MGLFLLKIITVHCMLVYLFRTQPQQLWKMVCLFEINIFFICISKTILLLLVMPEPGGRGPTARPQVLADQLTLFHPRGQILPTLYYWHPHFFFTFRHYYDTGGETHCRHTLRSYSKGMSVWDWLIAHPRSKKFNNASDTFLTWYVVTYP